MNGGLNTGPKISITATLDISEGPRSRSADLHGRSLLQAGPVAAPPLGPSLDTAFGSAWAPQSSNPPALTRFRSRRDLIGANRLRSWRSKRAPALGPWFRLAVSS